jgi:hypothetical protein
MAISFESYPYYPNLRTRPAEIVGYSKLADDEKQKIIPTFTLGSWPKQDGAEESLKQAVNAAGGNPFILDITKESSHQNPEIKKLFNPDDNFGAWRRLIATAPNAIPMVQIPLGAKSPQVIRQARHFEHMGLGKLAFKITDFSNDTEKVITALSALDSPENALVMIDLGYIRETMAASIVACITSINSIRTDVEDAIIAVISTSFPASVTPYLDSSSGGQRGIMNILERVLHQEIGADAAIYGDHASIHAKVYPTTGGRYTPRIDYPMFDAWAFERRPEENSTGYISAAQALINNYPEILEENTWGAEAIRNASKSLIDGMKTPSSWIAARVNMHISRQLELSESVVSDEEELDDWLK